MVLAVLLCRLNEVVSTDRLIEDVWSGEPPDGARRTLQAYVSNLHKTLHDATPGTLTSRPPGYLLTADPQDVDAQRFEGLVDEGRRHLATAPATARARLCEALSLWRGTPYADLADEPSLRPEITRLEELRSAALAERIDADLALGRQDAVIGELETLIAEHPLTERFRAQLMLGLYRSGRQADALRAYRRTRQVLGEELGIEPSPDLQQLEGLILVQDPSLMLDAEEAEVRTANQRSVRGFELREEIGAGRFGKTYLAYQHSMGREVAVKAIRSRYANDPAFIRSFEAETKAVARLEHPHIVPLYDFWREPDGAFVVMHYYPCGSLASALEDGPLALETTVRIVHQIGSALGVAHRSGVVHRDVKPSNILLDENGNAYLSDFEVTSEVVGRMEPNELEGYPSPYAGPGDLRRSPPLPQDDVYGLAIVALQALTGRVDADPTLLPPEIARVINLATSQEPTDRYATVGAFVAALHGAAHPETTVPSVATELHNPYKGLRAFEEVDADDFFGRETLVASLVTELDGHGPGGRCLAVVGPSGCGKSSIVNAGLVPVLRRGALPGSDRWFIVQMYPGSRPFEALAAAMQRVAIDPDPDLFGSLAGGNAPLSTVIDQIVPNNGSGLLLVIDQFEEVFTLTREESTRVAFLDTLAAGVKDPETPFRLVLTLRADFYDRPLQYEETAALLHECMVTVMPLSGNDLERAIVMPVARVGGALDPGLAGRIAADVADQPGALPLLQYAMTDLFERREGNLLTAEAYDMGGGVKGALGTRAEDIYGGLLPVEQAAARQVFLRLVTLGEGTEDTRRRVRRSELMSLEGLSGPALAVIETYGHHRLLSFDRNPVTRAPTVEVAHEALLREWSRLRSWIDDQRSDVRLHLQLADGTAEWVEADRDPEFLLSGGRLEHIDGWATSTDFALNEVERAFLEASIAQRDREVMAEEVRREHEEELEKRSERRLLQVLAIWALVAVVAVLAVFAFAQWRRAESLDVHTARAGEAGRLAATAQAVRNDDPQLALLLALRAVETTTEAGGPVLRSAEDALHLSMQAAHIPYPATNAPVDEVIDQEGTAVTITRLPLPELIETARSGVNRPLTSEECLLHLRMAVCPDPTIAGPAVN